MNPCKRPGYIEAVARGTLLCLDANSPDARRQLGQFIGYLHEFVVQLVIVNALKNLVIPVQSPVEAVVGAAPQAFAKFQIVLPSLADGPKETHLRTQRY